MASNAQRYAVGIGGGIASGAATGASIGGPWGALIGGVIGGGAGALSAAVQNSDEAQQREIITAARERQKKQLMLSLLRNEAKKGGYDTTLIDTIAAKRGMDYQNALEDRAYANANRLDPNAFVQMAQNGIAAGRGIYNSLNTPSAANVNVPTIENNQFQLQPMQGSLADEQYASRPDMWQRSTAASLIGEPDLLNGTAGGYDPNEQPQWARRLRL